VSTNKHVIVKERDLLEKFDFKLPDRLLVQKVISRKPCHKFRFSKALRNKTSATEVVQNQISSAINVMI